MSLTKTTIVLARRNHLSGYGTFWHNGQPWQYDGADTLDALAAWSKEHPDQQVYRHVVRAEEQPQAVQRYRYVPEDDTLTQEDCARLFEERLNDTEPRHRFETDHSIVHRSGMVYRVPYVDEVTYLDVYHQARLMPQT